MLANDAQTALANVLYPAADRVLGGGLTWSSHRRELTSTDVQAAQKSGMISMLSILLDLHVANGVANSPRSLLPKGISPIAGSQRRKPNYDNG